MGELRRYFDEAQMRDVVTAHGLEPSEQFSIQLLAEPPNPYLMVEGDKITLNMDNGKWVYVVTEVDRENGVVTAEWPD